MLRGHVCDCMWVQDPMLSQLLGAASGLDEEDDDDYIDDDDEEDDEEDDDDEDSPVLKKRKPKVEITEIKVGIVVSSFFIPGHVEACVAS